MKRLMMAASVAALMATSGCYLVQPAEEEAAAAPAPSLFVAPSEAGVAPAGAGRDTGARGGWTP